MGRILSCFGRYKKYAFFAPIFVAAESVLEICIPFLMSKIIDIGIANRDINYIVKMGLFMMGLALISMFCGVFSGYSSATAGAGFAYGLRKKLFSHIQNFSFSNTDKFTTGSLITRLTADVTNVQTSAMMILRMLVRSPVMVICATTMAFSINARLSVVFLTAIPVLAGVLGFISFKAFPRFRKMFEKYDRMNTMIQENLIGIRVVKAFVRGDYENERFAEAAEDLRQMQKHAEKILICNMPVMQTVMYSCMIAISWFGGNMIIAGGLTTGQFMSFITYINQILTSLMMISMAFVGIIMSKASLDRINKVLDEVPDIADNPESTLEVKNGDIEFSDVSFSYFKDENKLALRDINLKIKSGETVGILGGTGSSKTTLVSLIPRLYDTLTGEVSVGGENVRSYKISTLRDAVSVVLQKNVLFSGTIRENLLWGKADATDEELDLACRAACADEFISNMPDGYDTYLAQGGKNLSGGQKQRLCIARALLKKPKVLILDDSTSAVDTATDAKIRKAFREELPDITKIIIAQRISSVSDADKIVLLNEGKISDIGTHEELLLRSEIYKEIYLSQNKGGDVA